MSKHTLESKRVTAAAPEMLAALELFVAAKRLAKAGDKLGAAGLDRIAMDQAVAAIAKAKGGAA